MRRPLGPLGVRFAAAFVAVALFAVAVFSVAVLLADGRNVAHLASTQRDRAAGEVAALVATSYRSAGGWPSADLRPVTVFATQAGIGVRVLDRDGTVVKEIPAQEVTGSHPPMAVQRPLTVDGESVGTTVIDFPAGGSRPGDSHLRSSLFGAVGWSAALAVAAALLVGVMLARGVVRPLRRLAAAVGSLKLGDSSPRIGPGAGPGELGELGRAFDAMADSLEEEDRLRRALVADVAHELRTPVAVIQAETEALSDGITEPSVEALASLHEEAVRLARLVEDLQTLAAAQAAGLELTRRPLDLGRVATDAAQSLAGRLRAGHIQLRQDLPPTPAVGDPHRLHQVVLNLLTNAIKFTPGGGTVVVRTFADGAEAVLEVTDSGPGVPDSERQAIWERFYRGRAGRAGAGSGIGLAVVKELVDAHGGTVGLECPPGGGARFIVRLPVSVPEETSPELTRR
ncbi:MAG TPA: ATP-binding protein [Acidimicrobiales bacterium]|nr:ATP-binding protein [Acidimicrobiales bacterium]